MAQQGVRIHEVAKDLGINSKDIIAFLAEYANEPKNNQQVLKEPELNLIFDAITLGNQTNNLQEILEQALKNPPPKPPEPEKPVQAKEKPAKTQEKKPAQGSQRTSGGSASASPNKAKTAEGSKPKQAEKSTVAPATKPEEQRKSAPAKPVETDPAKLEAAREAARNRQLLKFAQTPQPARRDKKKQQEQQQSQRSAQTQTLQRTVPDVVGGVTVEENKESNSRKRVVDTRGVTINIDKYDDRHESLVDERVTSKQGGGKQKIKKQKERGQQTMAQGAKKRAEQRAQMQKLQLEMARKQVLTVSIPDEIGVADLAARMKKTGGEVVKQFVKMGMFISVSDIVDYETAALVAMEFGLKIEREVNLTIEEQLFDETIDADEDLVQRSPVVVVMGHVDHGKTSLLDYIRDANVVEGEAGGITQHIGAYQVEIADKLITFLDTPGHEAFTSMRARGAMVTDIAILVVAADDGIMPQTIEAINHAKAAEIPIIVAINKMDKAGANPDRIKQQLTEHGLISEDWGGDTVIVPISAKTGMGIDTLLEMVNLTAELRELKANPNRMAKGTVIEARLDKGRGPIATLLVQNGTLKQGDVIIAGTAVGHVRTMTNSRGDSLEVAGPSVPVEITGLSEAPGAGEVFSAVNDERMARELAEQRRFNTKVVTTGSGDRKVTLDNLFDHIQEGELKELNIIVKADVQGSAEAVKTSLEKLENAEVRVRVIHSAVGTVSESDIMLASTSNAIIVGFNIRPDNATRESAERQGVDMRMYRIIYECIEEIKAAMKGMLAPKFREAVLGHAEVRQTYKVSKVGTIAGCYVQDGAIKRGASVRILRDGIIIHEGELASLKRFKDDAREVVEGYECGLGIERFNDIKVGDIVEAFVMEEIAQ